MRALNLLKRHTGARTAEILRHAVERYVAEGVNTIAWVSGEKPRKPRK
jgi:hypothetical protein